MRQILRNLRSYLLPAMLLIGLAPAAAIAAGPTYNGEIVQMTDGTYKLGYRLKSPDALWNYYQANCRTLFGVPGNKACNFWPQFFGRADALNPGTKWRQLPVNALVWVPLAKGTSAILAARDKTIGDDATAMTKMQQTMQATIDDLKAKLAAMTWRFYIATGAFGIAFLLVLYQLARLRGWFNRTTAVPVRSSP